MRVMHVAAPAPYGGLEQVVRALATGHAARGHEVHVVAVVDAWIDRHPFVDGLAGGPVRVHAVRVARRRYDRERRAVRSLIEAVRPDVVHTHGYRADVVSAPVARGLGLPTVTTVHGFTGGGLKNRLYETLQRRSFRRADAVVAVSNRQRDLLEADGRLRGRVVRVPNEGPGPPPDPLDRATSREALGLPASGFGIGWVGRLSREKGPDVLVEALARLTPDDWRAVLIGDGPLRDELLERIRTLGLEDRVRLVGVVPAAARVFAAFDVPVLSSRTEGMPIVLLEAVAAGVPLVATAVGGVPEALDGRGGLVVPPESPGELAAALATVRRDPSSARVDPGPATATGEWLDAYEAIYRRVMAGVRG